MMRDVVFLMPLRYNRWRFMFSGKLKGKSITTLRRNLAGIALIVFFALFFTACRNNTTCLPINWGCSNNGSPGGPGPVICAHSWSDWARDYELDVNGDLIVPLLYQTTRICEICGAPETFMRSIPQTVNIPNLPALAKPLEMVRIPAGSFMMGSPDNEQGRLPNEGPQQRVTLTQSFYMSQHLITQAQWIAVMGGIDPGTDGPAAASGGDFPVSWVCWIRGITFANRLSIQMGLNPVYEMRCAAFGNYTTDPDLWVPMILLHNSAPLPFLYQYRLNHWNYVRIIDSANGFRLPTEAQWEYAARAGTTTAFNDGLPDWSSVTVNLLAWTNASVPAAPHRQVGGQLRANAWGLYDMHSNLGEWVWDWARAWSTPNTGVASQFDPVNNIPTATPTTLPFPNHYRREIRGGAFSRPMGEARSARRLADTNTIWPWTRGNNIGLRLVRIP